MNDLLKLIERFQNLKDKTGTNKCSSYTVDIWFDTWSNRVVLTFGGYDVGNWSRSEVMETTREKLLLDFEKKVQEAEKIVSKIDIDEDWDY